ncbi:MAG TPA: hypothetical protein VF407_04535 [Polyangiaceae bacterium]
MSAAIAIGIALAACSTAHPGNGYDEDFHDTSGFDCLRCEGDYRCGPLLSDHVASYVGHSNPGGICFFDGEGRRVLLICPSGDATDGKTDARGKILIDGTWKADRGILGIAIEGQPTLYCTNETDAGKPSL